MSGKKKLRLFEHLLTLLFLCLVACSQPKQEGGLNKYSAIENKWIGKKISFPITLQAVSFTDRPVFSPNSKKPKVVTLIDADCSVCLAELEEWKKFIASFPNRDSINFIFIMTSENEKYMEYHVNEVAKLKNIVLYDRENEYAERNELHIEKEFRTVLLTKEDNICLIGSPLYLPEMKLSYYQKMDSLIYQK